MALSVASVGGLGNASTGTTFTVPVPSGVTAGALVCIAVIAYSGSDPATLSVTGFTLSKSSPALMNAFDLRFKVYWLYKYATTADTGTYTGAMTAGDTVMAYAFRVAGWTGTGDPYADPLHEAVTDGGATTVASFTPAGPASLLTSISLDSGAHIPSGWTVAKSATDADGDTITLATLVQTTATPTGALTYGSADGTIVSVATIRQATTIPHGGGTGSSMYTGTATGHTSSHGAATGTLTFTGAASGHLDAEGHASGAIDVTGSAAGHAPAITQPHGTAAGTVTFQGVAAGTRQPHGAATGAVAFQGTTTGHITPHGGTVGALEYTGVGTGHAPTLGVPVGNAAGTLTYTGTTAGRTTRHGAAGGGYTYTGLAHGTSTTARDITVTGHLDPPRWAGALTTRPMTGTLTPRRWEAHL